MPCLTCHQLTRHLFRMRSDPIQYWWTSHICTGVRRTACQGTHRSSPNMRDVLKATSHRPAFFFHSNVKMEGTARRNNFQLPRSLTQVSLIEDFLYLGYRRKLLQNSANCRQLSVRWCSAVQGIIAVVRSAFPKAKTRLRESLSPAAVQGRASSSRCQIHLGNPCTHTGAVLHLANGSWQSSVPNKPIP